MAQSVAFLNKGLHILSMKVEIYFIRSGKNILNLTETLTSYFIFMMMSAGKSSVISLSLGAKTCLFSKLQVCFR